MTSAICDVCGSIRASHESACPSCGTPYAGHAPGSDQAGHLTGGWGLLTVSFECRACGFGVPFAPGWETAPCHHCGIGQKVPPVPWGPILSTARRLLDLHSRRHPEEPLDEATGFTGKTLDSLRACGVTGTDLVFTEGAFDVTLTVAQPRCPSCRTPLINAENENDTLVCPSCQVSHHHPRPEDLAGVEAMTLCAPAEVSAGYTAAKVTRHDGDAVQAILCPQCGAHLDEPNQRNYARCTYCNTASYVAPILARGHNAVFPGTWVLGRSAEVPAAARERRRTRHLHTIGYISLAIFLLIVFIVLATVDSTPGPPKSPYGSGEITYHPLIGLDKTDSSHASFTVGTCRLSSDEATLTITDAQLPDSTIEIPLTSNAPMVFRLAPNPPITMIREPVKSRFMTFEPCSSQRLTFQAKVGEDGRKAVAGTLSLDCGTGTFTGDTAASDPVGRLSGELSFTGCRRPQ